MMKYDTKLNGTLTKAEKEQVLDLIRYFQSKEYTVKEALHIMSEATLTMQRAAMAERA